MPVFSCITDNQHINLRLDRYVSEVLGLLSRSQIKARNLKAKINNKDVKLSRLVKQGDTLELFWEDTPPENLIPQDIALNIFYEDKNQIVINKEQGMVVHPGAGNAQGTLANALLYRMKKKMEGTRPGIVHRLDKDTSGVIIAAYNEEAHEFLSRQFKARNVRKLYIAIVHGNPKEKEGRIETFIARDPRNRKRFTVCDKGRSSITYYKVIKNLGDYSLILLRPKTGRTHQLRVHMRHLGCPILGDPLYGKEDGYSLMLHARGLKIVLFGEAEPRVFFSPVPERFQKIISRRGAKHAKDN